MEALKRAQQDKAQTKKAPSVSESTFGQESDVNANSPNSELYVPDFSADKSKHETLEKASSYQFNDELLTPVQPKSQREDFFQQLESTSPDQSEITPAYSDMDDIYVQPKDRGEPVLESQSLGQQQNSINVDSELNSQGVSSVPELAELSQTQFEQSDSPPVLISEPEEAVKGYLNTEDNSNSNSAAHAAMQQETVFNQEEPVIRADQEPENVAPVIKSKSNLAKARLKQKRKQISPEHRKKILLGGGLLVTILLIGGYFYYQLNANPQPDFANMPMAMPPGLQYEQESQPQLGDASPNLDGGATEEPTAEENPPVQLDNTEKNILETVSDEAKAILAMPFGPEQSLPLDNKSIAPTEIEKDKMVLPELVSADSSVKSEKKSSVKIFPKQTSSSEKQSSGRDDVVKSSHQVSTRSNSLMPQIESSIYFNPIQDHLQQAYQAYQQGNLEVAKQKYQQTLALDLHNRDALLGLAVIAQRQNRRLDAEQLYKQVLQLDPRNAVASAGLISMANTANDTSRISEIKNMLQKNPRVAHLHFALANAYAEKADWPSAQAAYFDAYSLSPEQADYAYNLGVTLEQLGEPQAALRYYQEALQKNANSLVTFDRARLVQRIATLTAE